MPRVMYIKDYLEPANQTFFDGKITTKENISVVKTNLLTVYMYKNKLQVHYLLVVLY